MPHVMAIMFIKCSSNKAVFLRVMLVNHTSLAYKVFMKKKLFNFLLESVEQMNQIAHGEAAPSREFYVDASGIKQLRASIGLSQAKFAKVIDVQVTTLQNWEQGRREPTGPAKALLRALRNDPKNVLKALA